MKSGVQLPILLSSGDETWTHKVERVDICGIRVVSNGDSTDSMVVNNLQGKKGTTMVFAVL